MSTFAVNLANGETDEKGDKRLLGKLFTQSGVIESTALQVAAQQTPTMQLNISGSSANDNAIFINSSGDTYHGWNTAQTTVTIASNSTGNTMIDDVVAYINLSGGLASANNPGALVFTSVRGASANTAPTSTAIQTAVGSNNPYIILAQVTVGNGVSSINSGNIVDSRIQAWIQQPIYFAKPPTLPTGIQESGQATATGWGGTSPATVRYYVPFKTVMTNTPSTVTLSSPSYNNCSSLTFSDCSKYGFRVTLTTTVSNTQWDCGFSYVTVGN